MTSPDSGHKRGSTTTSATTGDGIGEVTAPAAAAPPSLGKRLWPRSTLLQHSLLMLVALVGVVLLVETVGPFRVTQLAAMAYYVPVVAGLTVLTGINGQVSLGHGGLMAVGAYTTAVLYERQEGLPYLVVVLVAVVVTALVGVAVGAAASRLRGPYLAGATLALAVGLPGLALYFEEFLGGEQGLLVSSPEAPSWVDDVAFFITGNEMTGAKYLAYLGWAMALFTLLLLSNLLRSRAGREWRAVRDDEVAAELSGINLGRARVTAFVVSSACAGVGGSLLAVVTGLVAPTSFTIVLSIYLLVAIVIGGLGSLLGAVVGSGLLVFLAPFLTDLGLEAGLTSARAANAAPLAFGLFLILVMLAAPQGLVGTVRLRYLTRKAAKALAARG